MQGSRVYGAGCSAKLSVESRSGTAGWAGHMQEGKLRESKLPTMPRVPFGFLEISTEWSCLEDPFVCRTVAAPGGVQKTQESRRWTRVCS